MKKRGKTTGMEEPKRKRCTLLRELADCMREKEQQGQSFSKREVRYLRSILKKIDGKLEGVSIVFDYEKIDVHGQHQRESEEDLLLCLSRLMKSGRVMMSERGLMKLVRAVEVQGDDGDADHTG